MSRLAVGALGLLASVSALGGAGAIRTTVTALSDTVTYAVPAGANTPALATFVGFEVRIQNVGGNTINHTRFTAVLSDNAAGQISSLHSVEGADCVATTTAAEVSCTIGQLAAGASAPAFRLFFLAPVRATSNTLPNGSLDNSTSPATCAGSCLSFAGTTYYAEGTGGLTQSQPLNSTEAWGPVPVALGKANSTGVKSAVPKSGGNFFTGSGGISTLADVFTTTVLVPASASSTSAAILEETFGPDQGCTNFAICYKTLITVPPPPGATAFSPYLTIVIRQDAANIKPGTKIDSVVPLYEGIPIGLCAGPTTPRTDGLPCIAARIHYKNRGVPGWTAALDGDFEWRLLNTVNGSYRLP